MDWGSLSEDQIDRLIVEGEREIGVWRMVQMAAIGEKKARKSHQGDGYRSIVNWMAARADVSHQTARSLCWTSSRLEEAPEVARQLACGEISFDRAEQLARLPVEQRSDHEGYDIAQLKRRVAHYRRMTPKREKRISNSGFLNFQVSADETTTNVWGELPGFDARVVEKAVDQRADEIIGSEAQLGVAQRRALALVAICQDSLYTTDADSESPPVEVAVTVDARTATRDGGQTGVAVLAGPRLGRRALEEIFCDGIVDVIGLSENGEPLNLGRRTRTVSRKLRRHVLTRDGGCTVEACPSHYRLEVHHTTPWSHGGSTDAKDLVTVCWYHHHISIHREGLQIIRLGISRIRLKRPR